MKTLKYYLDLYLKCDVLLLADVFEKFINNSSNNIVLCPSHYLSAPAVSWDTILHMTKVVMELIPDPDMYIFFGKRMRGRVVYITNIYIYIYIYIYILQSYDPKQESKHN